MIDVVCGVIENASGCFLACLRPQGKHLGGHWEFPGGKVEASESAETALVRELHEELGVRVQVGAALQPVIWAYAAGAIRLLPYRCNILEGEARALEHEAVRWCAPADFDTLDWAAADLPILEQIRAAISESAN